MWPDGYYMSINQFAPYTLQFAGQGVAVFNRAAMLSGQPANMVYFDLASVDPNLGGMLPSDLDGPPPPAGSPNFFVQMDDDALGYPADQLELWRFHADWTTPANSSFTGPALLPVAAFDSNLCASARDCIPQPGTTAKLDALSDRLMYRLQYRNFGTHESLVVNQTVDVDGTDHAGVRWYEIRNPGGSPFIQQQGTYAPDSFHRWMGSAAMDGAGNLAIAYNVASSTLAPSIRYAARLATDPPGVLAQGEADLIIGSGAQTHSASRWGDYSMLSVDPLDDCTFWATAEYFATTSLAGWQTRIGAFRLPGCGVTVPPPDAPSALTASSLSSGRVNLAWTDGSTNEYGFNVERCTGPMASCASFTQVGATAAGVTAFADTLVQPATTYSYRVKAYNSGGSSAYSNTAEATTQAAPTVSVSATTPTATEAGPVSGVFTVSRGAAQDSALTVSFTVGGTATSGTDYQAVPTSVTIPAGAASATVTIVPVNDTTIEPDESVVLTLTPSSAYAIGGPGFATVMIVSDDLSVDLTPTSLVVPASSAAGRAIDVTDTTKNQGIDAVGSSVTSFYLSTNYLLEPADVLLGTRTVPPLAAGAASTATTSLTLPASLVPATYVILAKVDGPEQVRETSESNNTRAAATKVGPDLVIGSVTAPATVGVAPFAVTESTSNQGAAGAAASTTQFYLSSNYSLDASDTPLQGRAVPALDPGVSSSATTMVTLPAGTAAGSYYLIVGADSGNAVAEHTETNNTRYVAIRVGGDLTVTALSVPVRAASGATIAVSDTTKNSGEAPVGPSTTAFFVSSNFTLDASDTKLAQTRAVPALDPGVSSSGSTNVTLPALAAGTWYVIASADAGNAIVENNETNNTRNVTVSIGPDLMISAMTSPSTGTAGGTISVADTVRNSGAEAAGASTTRFYLSLNGILDGSDILLNGTRAVGALAAGATDSGTTSLTLPAGVTGLYYIIAVADGGAVVAESSETNNTLLRMITIGS